MSTRQDFLEVEESANTLFHQNAVSHGFWDDIDAIEEIIRQSGHINAFSLLKRFDAMVMAEKIALIHSELSEALEAIRKDPSAPDHHCPEFTNLEVELADARIRIGDLAMDQKLRIGPAILAKHDYNVTRPYKHGKQS